MSTVNARGADLPHVIDASEPRAKAIYARLHSHRFILVSVVAVACVILAWQLASSLGWANATLLPSPLEVIATAVDLAQRGYRQTALWQHWLVSSSRALVAFIAAIGVGVPLGLLMGRNLYVNAAFNPFVQFLRPLPKIALVPLVILWFGIGEGGKFFLIFISTLLSIVVSSAAAVQGVSQARMRAAQTLGASRRQQFIHVILPNALPEVMTGIRLSVGIGWTSLIAAEMVAANSGLGWMVINASAYLRTDVVMLGIFLLGVTGVVFDWVITALQRRLAPWAGRDV